MVLILFVFALAITSAFITSKAQAEINLSGTASSSARFGFGNNLGAFLISTARFFRAESEAATLRVSAWFAADTPSLSSMLFLGGGLLLFDAILRRRVS